MKKIVLIFTVILLATGCNTKETKNQTTPLADSDYLHILQIKNIKLNVAIAKTPAELEHGLSDRASMKDNQGMLFDFGTTPSSPNFWMKDMKFNLDLIWILKNKVVGVTENIPVPITCNSSLVTCHLPTYPPPSPVTRVLEVNAGWSKKNNIEIGDEVKLIK